MNIRIIQCSKIRTGSTLLVNILAGFVEYKMPISFHNRVICAKGIVLKTHNIDIDYWMNRYKGVYDLYFVCSNRGDKVIDKKYDDYPNVFIFDYDEDLNDNNTLNQIIDNIHLKLKSDIPLELNKENAITRIVKMNEFYKEIADKPFSYHDSFYGLHGSHRNRLTSD